MKFSWIQRLALMSLGLVASGAFAKATLRLPLLIEGGDDGIPAAEINKKLQAVGAPLLPLTIEVSSTERDVYKKFEALDAKIEESLKKLGPEYEYVIRATDLFPNQTDRDGLYTCYTGEPKDVIKVVSSLTDVVYSEQMNIWGWKYKKTTHYVADNSDGTLASFLEEGSKLWKEWRGQGEAILILTAVGDGGDDINESILSRCR